MDLAKLIAAHLQGEGHADALEHGGRWYRWRELQDTAGAIDRELSTAGIGPGARVALVARNRPALVAAMLALMASRRRIVMVYAFQSAAALAADLHKLAVPAVIADAEDWSAEARAAVRASGGLALALSAGAGLPLRCLVERPAGAAAITEADRDIAVEMLTSGTTGAPKRAPIPWSTINAAAADLIGSDPDRSAGAAAPPDILPWPIGNISGLYYLIPAVGTGRRLVLMERFVLDEWLDALRRHGCTYAAVPPAAVRMLLDSDLQAGELGQLAALGVGAAPLDVALQERFEERFKLPVLIGYGATEFCGVIATWTPEEHQRFAAAKRGSVGRARPGVSLRIVDRESGAECAPGSVGVIEARVPRVGPDFVRTTDLGSLDGDGFLFLHGRADQIINRGGFKVDPLRITAALCTHPAVADAGAVGIRDERLGQVPAAAVELRRGQPRPSEAELLAYLRDHLRSFEMPSRIRIVDALPRTPSMKVRLADLPALFATENPEESRP